MVSYLGNDVFRFTETGSRSGTDLNIMSAVTGSFSGGYVDLFAGRFLTQQAVTTAVPEPDSATMLLAGLLLLVRSSRSAHALVPQQRVDLRLAAAEGLEAVHRVA